jgi:translocation and assembly module TamB
VAATQSEGGRDWIRAQVSALANRGLHGKLTIGRISGSFLTDLRVDSIELRDPDDSVFIATGPVSLRYDPRDLADGRFVFRAVEARNPLLVIRRELDGKWNFRKVFPVTDTTTRPVVRLPHGAFGALVLLHDIRVRGGEVRLVKPWHPDDSLGGSRRDSAIAVNLADSTNAIRRVELRGRRGFQRTWRWKDIDTEIRRLRFRHPDSTGRLFEIARLDVNETIPPFAMRDMRGTALWRGDTVWFEASQFRLPHSVGRGTGKIEWPTGDTFWDVHLQSDSTALADLHWIYATLPVHGGGPMRLHIKSRAKPDVVDYAITDMDVRSDGSRLRGDMTYGVGGPVLEVRNVRLSLEPADFRLFETLNGKPFPYPWNGTVTGTVRASGGPVNRFKVEDAVLRFTDRNVAGATAAGTAHGEIDILHPGDAKFHGLQVNVDHFDLRTPQFLNASFPSLNGMVGGTATLDSIWTDVRVRDADVTHTDGTDTPPSRFRGGVRVTLGDNFVGFDIEATAFPLSATTVAKSYPSLPLRGEYRGPLRVLGTVADLTLTTDLVGEGGRVQLDGRFDAYSPTYRATVRGAVNGFDLPVALGRPALPSTALDARFAVDVAGDSLANLTGTAQVVADRSVIDSVRVFGARAALRFGGGRVAVDSARIESVAGELVARGALGLTPAVSDTLRFAFTADSLGGLRRYLARRGTAEADSLVGSLRASGVLTGRTSRFAFDAAVDGAELRLRSATARSVRGTVALSALPDSATGAMTLRFDALRTGNTAFTEAALRADLLGGWQARTTAAFVAPSGVTARAVADLRRLGDTTLVRLDSLHARTSGNSWASMRRTLFAIDRQGFRFDSLVLAGERGGRLAASGRASAGDTVGATLRLDDVPLADVGELLQTEDPMAGRLSMRADVRGTKRRPDLFFTGRLAAANVGGFAIGDVDADGRYADRRLTTSLAMRRGGTAALHADASLPLDLAFQPEGPRFLEDPLTARVRTDSATLGLLEAFLPSVRNASGGLRVDLDVSGTWKHPRATGSLAVSGGALALRPMGLARIEGLDADVAFLGDSIAIRRLAAHSGADRAATASLNGGVSIRDVDDPVFGLRLDAQRFNVVNDPRLADMDLTGSLALSGRRSAARLTGGFTVDRGEIRLPELYQKRLISLDDPNFLRVVDTTARIDRGALAGADTVFMNNLSVSNVIVRMGPDVWLRSEEANINLGGFVTVSRTRIARGPAAGRSQLALEGPLQTVRGTYRLNLGPVQRTFTVESGDVRFYGDPDLNATLNINAGYVVRQVTQQGARPDVRVRVRIGGTRLSPTLELSTPDSSRVTTADLISYLTTGGPSNEISGRGADYTATRALLTSVGSYLGGKVSGGLCDDAQLSTAGLDAYQGRLRDVSGKVLQGTRLNCAKQISDRLFVRLDAGLCQVGRLVDSGSSSAATTPIADTFGAKLDYRLGTDLTLSVGVEPPTSALFCRDDASARGFAPTPRQLGVDLFRLWRF